jgi:hypothetical protein
MLELSDSEILHKFVEKRFEHENGLGLHVYDFHTNLDDLHFAEKLLVDDELVEYVLSLQDVLGVNPTKLGDKIALVLAPPDKKAKALAKTIKNLNFLEPIEY